jgi:hypothetical protein
MLTFHALYQMVNAASSGAKSAPQSSPAGKVHVPILATTHGQFAAATSFNGTKPSINQSLARFCRINQP